MKPTVGIVSRLATLGSWPRHAVVRAIGPSIFLLLLGGLPRGLADEPTGADILMKLKRLDAVYLAALSAEADVRTQRPHSAATNADMTLRVSLSLDGPRRVVIEEQARPELRYVPDDKKQPRGLRGTAAEYDEAGNMEVSVREKVITLFEESLSSQAMTDTFYSVTPAHEVTQTFQSTILSRCAPDASTLVLPLRRVFWSLGRGFGEFLDEVTRVERSADGLIKVAATGVFDRGDPGRWELEIDPRASYIVRAARFYATGASQPCLTMTNTDIRLKESCQYPAQATFDFRIAGLGDIYNFAFAEARLAARPAYFDAAKQLLDGPLPPNCIVNDYRTEPRTTIMTDDKGNVRGARHAPVLEPPGLSPDERARWFWVFGVNLAVFLAISGYFLAARRRQRVGGTAPGVGG